MPDQEPTHFLNVDLCLRSKQDLSPIADYLLKHVGVNHNGYIKRTYFLSFSLIYGEIKSPNADKYIMKLCKIISDLPPDLFLLWENCSDKMFDIGYQAGTIQHPAPPYMAFQSLLKPKTINSISNLKGSINITIYPYIVSENVDQCIYYSQQ